MNPELLERVLRREIPGFEQLLACDKLTGGASQETYRVQLRCNGEDVLLALRRSPLADATEEAVGLANPETEAKLIQTMHAAGIPEPAVHYVLHPEDDLGRGFVMQWLEGEALGARIVRAEEFADIRPHLAQEFGAILARIHAIDVKATGLADELVELTPAQLVQESWENYKQLTVPVPMIDYAARWLLERLPGAYTTGLVHGDYRNGNIMINSQGVVAVLDWEITHLGDPVRDLGWLCVNSWRFGNRDLPVGGFGTREQLLEGYQSVSGTEVDPEHLRFWEVFGSFWWAVACLRMSASYRSGDNPSLERPAIGRRSSEAQMDCVNLVIPGSFELPEFDEEAAKSRELPLAQEMLESVASWLREEVSGQVEPRNAFLARVAANSLKTVERELSLGPQLRAQESERLTGLGMKGELHAQRAQLVKALRQGLDLDTPGLAEHLRQTVAGQLAVDQPRYTALQQLDKEEI